MGDTYLEHLVKQARPVYAGAATVALYGICFICLVATFVWLPAVVALVAAIVATYFITLNLDLEFEYLFVNGQLTIDKIMKKSRRKKVWDGDMESLLIAAPADSGLVKNYDGGGQMKCVDCSSKDPSSKAVALIVSQGQSKLKLIIDPQETIIRYLKQRYPSKVSL
ncbi:MAG: DUF6106 family protein [Lachnospiraceae bacterium]|jgi:hypothetical protein|nr:DUF6106 family protein [Lachnospiraceae bacterium]